MGNKKHDYYVVSYRDLKEGKIRELKVKKIKDSSLGWSFIALSEFVFDTTGVVVNPEQEHLEKTFELITTYHLSIHQVLSIKEMGKKKLKLKQGRAGKVIFIPNSEKP